MAVNESFRVQGRALSGVRVRISPHVAPDEVLIAPPDPLFGGSLLPIEWRQELVCGFEAYWRLRWAEIDPTWREFGVELYRRTSARLRK